MTVSFHRLTPPDLKDLAAVAQTLDNQWVPRGLLTRMLDRGLCLADVRAEREAAVRTEYLRAVLNSEQLVVNRAYFFNNEAVARDFAEPGPAREAVKQLLNDAVLVPFLYGEDSPVHTEAGDRLPYVAGRQWAALAAETEMSCVRLSWTDSVNRAAVNRGLAVRFHDFVTSLKAKCLDGGDEIFASHLGVPRGEAKQLRRRFTEVAAWAFHRDERVMREDFYREFVVADGTEPVAGRYDAGKEYAGQLKMLVDLAYNTALPETLDRYPLRPEESLHRSALQEWKQRPDGPGRRRRVVSADTATRAVLLRRTAFDLETHGARDAGHQIAADLQAFRVEEPAEQLRQMRADLVAAGIEEIPGGTARRDGGLEQDFEAA